MSAPREAPRGGLEPSETARLPRPDHTESRHVQWDRRVRARRRRILVKWLRRTARRSGRVQTGARRDLWLHDRVGMVRDDLLQIADMLECADDPDPACLAELRRLLSDGCDSPLYNREVHCSELRATLQHVRMRLADATADRVSAASGS
jgi:hypothetical protein